MQGDLCFKHMLDSNWIFLKFGSPGTPRKVHVPWCDHIDPYQRADLARQTSAMLATVKLIA